MLVGRTDNNCLAVYGTLRECVDVLWKNIDFEIGKFPNFDFTASTEEGEDNICTAMRNSEGWFGCKNVANEFDCDTISVVFAHYGGGGIQAMEIDDWYDTAKKEFMDKIFASTDAVGYGLRPEDYTVFESREFGWEYVNVSEDK